MSHLSEPVQGLRLFQRLRWTEFETNTLPSNIDKFQISWRLFSVLFECRCAILFSYVIFSPLAEYKSKSEAKIEELNESD
jgi:hypothetical protein